MPVLVVVNKENKFLKSINNNKATFSNSLENSMLFEDLSAVSFEGFEQCTFHEHNSYFYQSFDETLKFLVNEYIENHEGHQVAEIAKKITGNNVAYKGSNLFEAVISGFYSYLHEIEDYILNTAIIEAHRLEDLFEGETSLFIRHEMGDAFLCRIKK